MLYNKKSSNHKLIGINFIYKKLFVFISLIKSSFAIITRELLLTYRNFFDILTILVFFILGILIFIFAIGPDNKIYSQIGIGIIWTLLLLSTNLSMRKMYQEDFQDGSIILFFICGISIEYIVILKIFTAWLFFQIPFLIIIPLASILLEIDLIKIKLLL